MHVWPEYARGQLGPNVAKDHAIDGKGEASVDERSGTGEVIPTALARGNRRSAPQRVHSDLFVARVIVTRRGVGRLKRIAIRELWLQDELIAGCLVVEKVGTNANYVDLFTKPA
eukprot:16052101-Heterocapsa_arctica.AAC.1